jgi:pyruvate dehydrogenase E2 component (dihydrolipoamide acetyltransferase)
MGVELGRVSGSGERGRITAKDIHSFVESQRSNGTGGGGPAVAPPLPDFSQWGEVEIESIKSVRRLTAKAMSRSWSLIPHVTNHDLADITELEAGRKAFKKANPKGVRVTMTALVAKACGVALKEFPGINSSLDLAAGKQIFKKHYHIGIAADTPHGLVVPVLRDVDKKSVLTIAEELTDLSARARDRKLGAAEMRGATFTVTNLGGIGGTSFTPIVNWPQVAILGVSRGRQEYVVSPQGPVPRLLMPLSLSYDHRVVDGALAARFLKRLTGLLGSPSTLLYSA